MEDYDSSGETMERGPEFASMGRADARQDAQTALIVAHLEGKIEEGFKGIEKSYKEICNRCERTEKRLDKTDDRILALEQVKPKIDKVGELEQAINVINTRCAFDQGGKEVKQKDRDWVTALILSPTPWAFLSFIGIGIFLIWEHMRSAGALP